jgi:hypothetical protein
MDRRSGGLGHLEPRGELGRNGVGLGHDVEHAEGQGGHDAGRLLAATSAKKSSIAW